MQPSILRCLLTSGGLWKRLDESTDKAALRLLCREARDLSYELLDAAYVNLEVLTGDDSKTTEELARFHRKLKALRHVELKTELGERKGSSSVRQLAEARLAAYVRHAAPVLRTAVTLTIVAGTSPISPGSLCILLFAMPSMAALYLDASVDINEEPPFPVDPPSTLRLLFNHPSIYALSLYAVQQEIIFLPTVCELSCLRVLDLQAETLTWEGLRLIAAKLPLLEVLGCSFPLEKGDDRLRDTVLSLSDGRAHDLSSEDGSEEAEEDEDEVDDEEDEESDDTEDEQDSDFEDAHGDSNSESGSDELQADNGSTHGAGSVHGANAARTRNPTHGIILPKLHTLLGPGRMWQPPMASYKVDPWEPVDVYHYGPDGSVLRPSDLAPFPALRFAEGHTFRLSVRDVVCPMRLARMQRLLQQLSNSAPAWELCARVAVRAAKCSTAGGIGDIALPTAQTSSSMPGILPAVSEASTAVLTALGLAPSGAEGESPPTISSDSSSLFQTLYGWFRLPPGTFKEVLHLRMDWHPLENKADAGALLLACMSIAAACPNAQTLSLPVTCLPPFGRDCTATLQAAQALVQALPNLQDVYIGRVEEDKDFETNSASALTVAMVVAQACGSRPAARALRVHVEGLSDDAARTCNVGLRLTGVSASVKGFEVVPLQETRGVEAEVVS